MGNFIFGGGSKSLNKGGLLTCRGRQVLPLSFALQPQVKTVDEYALATFSCEVTGGVAPYSYQWEKNGANVGTNSAALSFTAAATDNAASITVVVTDSTGSVITSTSAVLGVISYVYQLDGVTQRALTSGRLINPDGDIDIEFKTGPNAVGGGVDRTILSQCLTSTFGGASGKEFSLYFNSSGYLQPLHGGNFFPSSTNAPILANTKYRWRLQGSTQTFWVNGVQVDSGTVTRGTAREPSAQCVIGAQTNGSTSTFRAFFSGGIYGLKVSSVSTNEIPLNNKSQVANQLATAGSINATIVNYNANGWVAI